MTGETRKAGNACPICGGRGRLSHLTHEGRRVPVAHCRACRYYWIDPETLPPARVGDYQQLLESVRSVREVNNGRILKALDALFPGDGEVRGLEVGCGQGGFLAAASEYARFRFTGIEPMEESHRLCVEKGLSCIRGMFPDDWPPEQTGFDAIVFNDVFEHIPDSARLLRKCAELLNKDGALVVNCPMNGGVFFRAARAMNALGMSEAYERLWQLNTSSPHVHYFSGRALRRLLALNGFEPVGKPLKMFTLDKKSIAERVRAVPMDKTKAELFVKGLNIVYPLLRFFPDDTKCFIFKARAC